MIQPSRSREPRAELCGAGLPHRWQKWAPGDSRAWHATHSPESTGAPQWAQNFPVMVAPQTAHTGAGWGGGAAAGGGGEAWLIGGQS